MCILFASNLRKQYLCLLIVLKVFSLISLELHRCCACHFKQKPYLAQIVLLKPPYVWEKMDEAVDWNRHPFKKIFPTL